MLRAARRARRRTSGAAGRLHQPLGRRAAPAATLRRRHRTSVAFDSPDSWVLPGARCAIRLRDVDFDGQPEVFVSFQGVRASSGWIFKWDGAALRNLTPTETIEGRVSSLLLDPQLYDLDHQGALEVIASRIVERPAAGRPVEATRPSSTGSPKPDTAVQGSLVAVSGLSRGRGPAQQPPRVPAPGGLGRALSPARRQRRPLRQAPGDRRDHSGQRGARARAARPDAARWPFASVTVPPLASRTTSRRPCPARRTGRCWCSIEDSTKR